MKRIISLLFITIIIGMMPACSKSSTTSSKFGSVSENSQITLEAGKWPENKYTQNIPKPNAGKVIRGQIDLQKNFCFIELSNISTKESEQYLEKLEESGFKQTENVSEQINSDTTSVGTRYTDGKTSLNISYLDDSLLIYIK